MEISVSTRDFKLTTFIFTNHSEYCILGNVGVLELVPCDFDQNLLMKGTIWIQFLSFSAILIGEIDHFFRNDLFTAFKSPHNIPYIKILSKVLQERVFLIDSWHFTSSLISTFHHRFLLLEFRLHWVHLLSILFIFFNVWGLGAFFTIIRSFLVLFLLRMVVLSRMWFFWVSLAVFFLAHARVKIWLIRFLQFDYLFFFRSLFLTIYLSPLLKDI